MPSLERLHNALGGKDFTVLALSADRKGWDKISAFRKIIGLINLPIFHDMDSKMMFAAGTRGLPTTLLIGRDGREIGRLIGPEEWDSEGAKQLIRYYIGIKEGGD
jgi:thiol-disulfide isomerase/thioredoxin